MIQIKTSKTANTRSCDFAQVTKEQLKESSLQHICDVRAGLAMLSRMMEESSLCHDEDKLSLLTLFHKDFIGGFKETVWWDNHRKISRHHLQQADGVPEDVNLIDVLEMLVDCVMAGMARNLAGFYPPMIEPDVLMKAFNNTVELLKKNVEVCP
jgi:hypothetical protein